MFIDDVDALDGRGRADTSGWSGAVVFGLQTKYLVVMFHCGQQKCDHADLQNAFSNKTEHYLSIFHVFAVSDRKLDGPTQALP